MDGDISHQSNVPLMQDIYFFDCVSPAFLGGCPYAVPGSSSFPYTDHTLKRRGGYTSTQDLSYFAKIRRSNQRSTWNMRSGSQQRMIVRQRSAVYGAWDRCDR
ncbi:hypothetical protein ASPWEDRAFT_35836 [Aspergillus wentii DTO 134E9]|uniref:Uncharacterized protein n=1 Tax=Aspergillus wentii DTO 134E9 TaxID=1073089 RepID=A0A1L9RTE0_ASPWE|nr:uncharacterized protein ASPWEDRAFT_35836 [Aspergillus wentii DTO 134E9]OJJ38221.1 hypothetical protein ASPWEDRAFT_35836 [Aspergillus wentii DTO 134E9]